MAFSSVHEMIDLCKESGKPLYEVILESDLAESGLTRAESEAEMHRLWAVMQATSDGYCGADRSMSGFAGGDAAKVSEAAARGILYADGYFADVMAEALKTAEQKIVKLTAVEEATPAPDELVDRQGQDMGQALSE